jgi:hypothetical protein
LREENNMGTMKMKWLVTCAALAAAACAHADGDRTQAYIAPYVGYSHMRIDGGTVYQEPDTQKFDGLQFGASFGFRMPVGFLVEVGRSHAVHANLFYDDSDLELVQTSGAVGWRFSFADGWHFTPKAGRLGWELASDHRILMDDDGDRHKTIQGWNNFYELGLTKDLKSNISMGVIFQDVDEDFGHNRSGAFTVSFAF